MAPTVEESSPKWEQTCALALMSFALIDRPLQNLQTGVDLQCLPTSISARAY
jgi:hypothetical protein